MAAYFRVADLEYQGRGNQIVQISTSLLSEKNLRMSRGNKSAKIVPLPVETPTSSNQVTLFHRDGFFKATPNPPIFCAKKAGDESEKNVNDKNTQTITEEHDKSFVP